MKLSLRNFRRTSAAIFRYLRSLRGDERRPEGDLWTVGEDGCVVTENLHWNEINWHRKPQREHWTGSRPLGFKLACNWSGNRALFQKQKVKVKETWWRLHQHVNVWEWWIERKSSTNGGCLSHCLRSEFPQGPHLQDASSNDAVMLFIGFLMCTLKPRDSFILKMTPSFSALVRISRGHSSHYRPWRGEEPLPVHVCVHVFATLPDFFGVKIGTKSFLLQWFAKAGIDLMMYWYIYLWQFMV